MARPTLPNFALASTFQGFEWFHYRFGRIVITSFNPHQYNHIHDDRQMRRNLRFVVLRS